MNVYLRLVPLLKQHHGNNNLRIDDNLPHGHGNAGTVEREERTATSEQCPGKPLSADAPPLFSTMAIIFYLFYVLLCAKPSAIIINMYSSFVTMYTLGMNNRATSLTHFPTAAFKRIYFY